jgi:NAD-dependent deacetylase
MTTIAPALIQRARDFVRESRTITVLTGAGMSAESGIPTFRQAQTGLWAQYSPAILASPEGWRRDPGVVWGWYLWRMAGVRAAQPNAGHRALAEAAKTRDITLVTQNVDDLHERAGSRDVLHLHGELFAHRCFACARPFGDVTLPDISTEPAPVEPPRCSHCQGRIRPGVVWFGEDLPAGPYRAAVKASESCDLMLVIGTAGVVYPAAGLPAIAKQRGARIVEINPEQTELSPLADVCLRGGAAEVVPGLFEESPS